MKFWNVFISNHSADPGAWLPVSAPSLLTVCPWGIFLIYEKTGRTVVPDAVGALSVIPWCPWVSPLWIPHAHPPESLYLEVPLATGAHLPWLLAGGKCPKRPATAGVCRWVPAGPGLKRNSDVLFRQSFEGPQKSGASADPTTKQLPIALCHSVLCVTSPPAHNAYEHISSKPFTPRALLWEESNERQKPLPNAVVKINEMMCVKEQAWCVSKRSSRWILMVITVTNIIQLMLH